MPQRLGLPPDATPKVVQDEIKNREAAEAFKAGFTRAYESSIEAGMGRLCWGDKPVKLTIDRTQMRMWPPHLRDTCLSGDMIEARVLHDKPGS